MLSSLRAAVGLVCHEEARKVSCTEASRSSMTHAFVTSQGCSLLERFQSTSSLSNSRVELAACLHRGSAFVWRSVVVMRVCTVISQSQCTSQFMAELWALIARAKYAFTTVPLKHCIKQALQSPTILHHVKSAFRTSHSTRASCTHWWMARSAHAQGGKQTQASWIGIKPYRIEAKGKTLRQVPFLKVLHGCCFVAQAEVVGRFEALLRALCKLGSSLSQQSNKRKWSNIDCAYKYVRIKACGKRC
eukprot:4701251-Amphidinium_carterae.1